MIRLWFLRLLSLAGIIYAAIRPVRGKTAFLKYIKIAVFLMPCPNPNNFQCLACSFVGRASVKYDFGAHKIYSCPCCQLFFLFPQPTQKELEFLYSRADYFKHASFFNGSNSTIYGYADYFAERMNRQKRYSKIVRQCIKLLNPKTKGGKRPRLLEVGCGPGYFLEVAHRAGFQVCGVEFNKAIVEQFAGNYPFPIRHGNYLSQNDTCEKWDCIVMLDVIEHLPNPADCLKKAYGTLKPNGILILSTVNSDSLVSRILGKRLEDFRRIREHLFFFNKKNIFFLLRENGFSLRRYSSIGHTFLISHLLSRLLLTFPFRLRNLALFRNNFYLLDKISISLNLGTKMIIYAKKITATQQ